MDDEERSGRIAVGPVRRRSRVSTHGGLCGYGAASTAFGLDRYDEETLRLSLRDAGFFDIVRRELNASDDEALRGNAVS